MIWTKAYCTETQSLDDIYLTIFCTHETEPDIAVALRRVVVVTVSRPSVLGVVVPTTTPKDAVRAGVRSLRQF